MSGTVSHSGITYDDLVSEVYYRQKGPDGQYTLMEKPDAQAGAKYLCNAAHVFANYQVSGKPEALRIRFQHLPKSTEDYIFGSKYLIRFGLRYKQLLAKMNTTVRQQFQNVHFVNLVDIFEPLRASFHPAQALAFSLRWGFVVHHLSEICHRKTNNTVNQSYVQEQLMFSVVHNRDYLSEEPDFGGHGNHIFQTALILNGITPDAFQTNLLSYCDPNSLHNDRRICYNQIKSLVNTYVKAVVISQLGECRSDPLFEKSFAMSLVCSAENTYGSLATALFCTCAMIQHVKFGYHSVALLEVSNGHKNIAGLCAYQKFGFQPLPHFQLHHTDCFGIAKGTLPLATDLYEFNENRDDKGRVIKGVKSILDHTIGIALGTPRIVFIKHLLCGIKGEVNPYNTTVSLQQLLAFFYEALYEHNQLEHIHKNDPQNSATPQSKDDSLINSLFHEIAHQLRWKRVVQTEKLNTYDDVVKWLIVLFDCVQKYTNMKKANLQKNPDQPVPLFSYLCDHLPSAWLLIHFMSKEAFLYDNVMNYGQKKQYLVDHNNTPPNSTIDDPVPVVPAISDADVAVEVDLSPSSSSSHSTPSLPPPQEQHAPSPHLPPPPPPPPQKPSPSKPQKQRVPSPTQPQPSPKKGSNFMQRFYRRIIAPITSRKRNNATTQSVRKTTNKNPLKSSSFNQKSPSDVAAALTSSSSSRNG